MIKYSEEQMGTAFHYYMKHGQIHKIGHGLQIYYEFAAMQGVADFIAVHREGFSLHPSSVLYKLHTDCKVYSLLKRKSGRSKAYLYENVIGRILHVRPCHGDARARHVQEGQEVRSGNGLR